MMTEAKFLVPPLEVHHRQCADRDNPSPCICEDINHVCTSLDKYGYCVTCNTQIITHFKGFPLPERPNDPTSRK